MDELGELGATFSHSPTIGVTHLNLSDEISYEKSISISSQLSKEFMTARDYFDLKSFSYFSRDYFYDDFLKDLSSENHSKLDFRFKKTLTKNT